MLEQYFSFTIIFKVGLLPYLKLTTAAMKRNNLINHKEVVVVCEENGHVNMSYNVSINHTRN
jgi:hypothetical protein